MKPSKRRTLLVSIDAACWEYLDPLLAQGRLPAVREIMDSGVHGILHSTMPPMTPVAWSTIATGKEPAKHGVYEWLRRKRDGYEFVPFTAEDRIGKPFWDRLGDQGIRVGLVNVPFTYPPPQVNGFVVCGFGAPESAQDSIYPAELRNEIERLYGAYQPAESAVPKSGGDIDALFEAERCLQEQQVRIAIAAARRHDVDVLVINLMFLDHGNHFFPDMPRLEDALADTDSHLRLLLKGFQADTVLLISDHGSRRIGGRFLLGSWLSDREYISWPDHRQVRRDHINWLLLHALQKKLGWVNLFEKVARRLAVEVWLRARPGFAHLLWKALEKQLPLRSLHYWTVPERDPQSSKVYGESAYGCLYLNVRGREPNGLVPSERQAKVLKHLVTELSDVIDPDTGEPLFSNIYEREASYSDAATGQPPDLVLDYYSSRWGLSWHLPPPVVPRDGYFVRDTDVWYGEHSRQGIFALAGSDIGVDSNPGSASLPDIPATLLHLHGVPIPDDYDGRVLTELLEPDFVSARPIRYQPGDLGKTRAGRSHYPEMEAAEVLERLRGLGYVE
jgi:predicted AlkP superfamily phosphohydrolase/phosphomutase